MDALRKNCLKVIGIDPGSRFTGFGIINVKPNGYDVIDYGVLRIKPEPFHIRLLQIYEELSEIIQTHQPDVMSIEQVFVANNPGSALKLGQARGAALLAGASAGLPVEEYTALQIKKAIAGYGHATKEQMQQMIMLLLGLPKIPQADAADALSIALCHGQAHKVVGNTQNALDQLMKETNNQALAYRGGRLRRRRR